MTALQFAAVVVIIIASILLLNWLDLAPLVSIDIDYRVKP